MFHIKKANWKALQKIHITRRRDAGYKDLPSMLGIPPLRPKGSSPCVPCTIMVLYMAYICD